MRARTFWFGIAAICLTLIIVTWLFGPGAADKAISVIGGAVLLGLLGVLYFIPALLSRQHSHRNVHTIFAVNLLLGWNSCRLGRGARLGARQAARSDDRDRAGGGRLPPLPALCRGDPAGGGADSAAAFLALETRTS